MLFVFIGLLLGTLLLNKLLFHYSSKNLSYDTKTDQKVYEIGEEIKVMPVIENRKYLSVPFLRVDEYYDPAFSVEVNSYSLFLLPFQRVKRTYTLKGKKRGVHYVEAVSLRIGDLLGFHHSFQERSLKIPVVILPEKRALKDVLTPYASLQGPVSVKRWIMEDPLMIRGIREYTGQESERYIHWPSSLKHDRLMVKQFDFTSEKSVLVFLNMESVKPFWKDQDVEAMEEALICTRAVMEELTKEKVPFGFASNGYNQLGKKKGHFYPAGLSKENLQRYNELLGKMSYVIAMPFEESLKALTRNKQSFQSFVLITPHVLPDYVAPLKEFTRSFGKTVIISMGTENLKKLSASMDVYEGGMRNGTASSRAL